MKNPTGNNPLPTVTILNPHDSQGNHITDGQGIYPCLRGCGGAGYQQGYVLQHLKEDMMNKHALLILNDQGGSVMDVQEDVTATLRAQDHGHPPVVCMAFDVYNMQGNRHVFKTLNNIATDSDHIPVVCFEPGILSRDCSAGNRAYVDVCSTLRAQMGDNQPAVCYEVEYDTCFQTFTMSERQISMMVTEDVSNTIAATDYKGSQVVCYEVNNG